MPTHQHRILAVLATVVIILWYNSLREQYYVRKRALVHPKFSPWTRLLNLGDEGSFITLTGFNFASFRLMVDILNPTVVEASNTAGRPSALDFVGQLGLFLFFCNSNLKIKHLCMLFGVVPSTCSRVITNMLFLVCRVLSRHPDSKISFPSSEEMEHLAALVALREPRVQDVIGFLDGMTIPVQCAEDLISQSKDYNGHTKETCCNNLFLFGPDGLIKWASVNFPGSMHDSTVASQLIAKVIECIGAYKICVDQGFPRGGALFDRFVGPYSTKILRKIAPRLRRLLVERSHIYTSLRQSSEWGMRAL